MLRPVHEFHEVVIVGERLASQLAPHHDGEHVLVLPDVPAGEIIAPRVYADPDLLEAADIKPRSLTKSPLTLLDPDQPTPGAPLPLWARAVKRTVDILASLAGLVLLAIPFLVISLLIRRDSPGPALFTQERIGTDGRVFRMHKFRTMVAGNDTTAHQAYVQAYIEGTAQRHGTVYKMADDPRVTPIGAKLRAWSVDELPQLWNVLKGDMSLIGPRPCLPYEADLFGTRTWQRLRVKPGITGPWQVSGRTTLSYAEAVELDIAYWQNWRLGSEVSIFFRTPVAIISRTGAV